MCADADGNLAGKRLVIFGCGYVGSEVARQAVARGMSVTALTRNEAKAQALRTCGIETVVADLADDRWHRAMTGAPDFVLSCVSSGGGGIDGYTRSYVRGNASMVAWLRANGPGGTLVYTGSTSVYPQGEGACVNETAPTENMGGRARILLEAEAVVRGATAEADGGIAARRWFVLRLAGIYGPGRHHLIEQVRAGDVTGNGEHRMNLVHRDDIVAAIWASFVAPPTVANEVLNISDDHPTAKREVVRWLVDRTGWPLPRFSGVPLAGRAGVTPDRVISNAKAARVLGWRPRYPSFREGYENLLSH